MPPVAFGEGGMQDGAAMRKRACRRRSRTWGRGFVSSRRGRLALVAIAGLALLGVPRSPAAQLQTQEVRIAFIGDQGGGAEARAVLELIRDEGADAVIHSGDFDYNDDPAGWDGLISDVLGEDMPYFASAGNHDDESFYGPGGYQEFLEDRLNRIGISWSGDLGVRSNLSYRGIFLVLTTPDIFANDDGDTVHAPFIRAALAGTDANWRISSFHKNMRPLQTGDKSNETGWGVYEESRRGGAIIATGHEHAYSRTHLLSEVSSQTCAIPDCTVPPDNTLRLAMDDPDTPEDEGRSFAFVSGLGGQSVRRQRRGGDWWASIYTSTQGASSGALFGVFNYQGDPNLAYFYMKDVAGQVPDEFFVSSPIQVSVPALQVADVEVDEGDLGVRLADFDVTLESASSDPVSVDYATSDGTAEAGIDYQATAGSLVFAPGQTLRTIRVPVIGDRVAESDETFFMDLFDPVNATLGVARATGTILDDDPVVETFVLSVAVVGSGSVTLDPPGGSYPAGTLVTLTAVPAADWTFAGWSGDLGGAASPTALGMSGDRHVEARFVLPPPPNQPPSGTILEPSGAVSVAAGEPLSFSGVGSDPDADLPLSYLWTFDDSGLASSNVAVPGELSFPAAGTYRVRLTVSDALGLADPTPAEVVVTVHDVLPMPGAGFVDVTEEAGIDYVQQRALRAAETEPDGLSGGAAAGDYDRDGHVDLYVSRLDASGILYRNRGDGTFQDVTAAAGLVLDAASNGAGWGDVDNDGDLDLYVSTWGPDQSRSYLFVNDGDGGFTEEALERGCALEGPEPYFGFSVTFGDYDLDGWLDLHTTEWRSDAEVPPGVPGRARLLRNRGEAAPGFFEDVTDEAGVALEGAAALPAGVSGTFALSSRFADLDDDGWPELLVVAGFGSSRLFWNRGNGVFEEDAGGAGVAGEQNGAGSDVGDHDGDGRIDWAVASIFEAGDPLSDGNRLYRNEGGGGFSDATDAAGVRDGGWATGVAFVDLDNDGDLDLVMTNGRSGSGASADVTRIWINNGDGAMRESALTLGLGAERPGRGLLSFDYDADGDLDLFIANHAGGPQLYRNDMGNRKGWLRVVAVGSDSNRDGIGAVVRVFAGTDPPQVRQINAGSHFLGQSEFTAHFGLGAGPDPERVEVFWPASGRTSVFRSPPRNATLTALEPGAGASSSGGSCGLVGVEPWLLLAFLWQRRRGRRREAAQA